MLRLNNMESWSVIRLQNLTGVRLHNSMKLVLYGDAMFEFNPPLKYQLHGLQKVLDDIKMFMFDPLGVLADEMRKQISLTKLWTLYHRWNISAYVCVLPEDIIKDGKATEKYIQAFFNNTPTTSAVHVIFLKCKAVDTAHCQHSKDKLQGFINKIANGRKTMVSCSHYDLKTLVKNVVEKEFIYSLQILHDKISSFEKQTEEALKKDETKAQKIEQEIVTFLQNLTHSDSNMLLRLSTGKEDDRFFCLSDYMLDREQNVIIDRIFQLIWERFHYLDRKTLHNAVQYSKEEYKDELISGSGMEKILQNAFMSLARSFCYLEAELDPYFVFHAMCVDEIGTYLSLVILVCDKYYAVRKSRSIVSQTLANMKKNSQTIAQRISAIYSDGRQEKVKFRKHLQNFSFDIKESLDRG